MKKLLVIFLIGLIAIAGLLFFLKDNLDEIVREIIVTSVSDATDTNVSLAQVKLNLKEGVGVLNNYQQGNPEGFQTKYAFRFDQAELEIDVGTILDDVVIIERVFINHADIVYEFNDGKTNFVELKKNIDKKTKKKNSDQKNNPVVDQKKNLSQSKTQQSKKIIIRSFEMINTEVEAVMPFASSQTLSVQLPNIKLSNIGAKENGLLADELVKVFLDAMEKDLKRAVNFKNLVNDLEKDLKKQIDREAEKAIKKIESELGEIENIKELKKLKDLF
ncbi:hypothetical protein VI34_00080 [Methylophilales bacterium MBRSG12]|uniref:AsmA domain-containing protein n=1 Tax=Methylophilales bacterium MBRS-H7 TaxID=1623450 RepID=A0A0H4IZF5_9PROT|nr:hypothetical protein UZ34_03040 [Methylophilales bacterium MBRSF5]AKO65215.1 hypothetical protein VI33_00080 [Methylophilales bacterium MBRS-H7]AKO66533.1 hypothetical protein VI34_00080 [Methylophilales bacterium MBRSG12]